MGKSGANLPPIVQNPYHDGLSQAQNPPVVVTPEVTSATRREKEVNLGGQARDVEITTRATKGIFVEGILKDCGEDDGEASDPPTRSFFRRQLDEQSWQFEQTFSREIKGILEKVHGYSVVHTKLLKVLVSNTQNIGHADRSRQFILNNNPIPALPAETGSARLKMIDLKKKGGSSSKVDEFDRGAETASVDMVEVQRMIDSTLKKGPKFPKFIHPCSAYVEKFELSLSLLEHVARFTAQCGDVNSDFHKLRLFNFSLTGSTFAWYINGTSTSHLTPSKVGRN
ncbi:hypothetical protein ACFXTI_043169 [Malus domestica]